MSCDISLTDHAQQTRFRFSAVALIIKDQHLLLNTCDATSDYWTLGGVIRIGETAYEAVRREATEETGLTVESPQLIVIVEHIFPHVAPGLADYLSPELSQYFLATIEEDLSDLQRIDGNSLIIGGHSEYSEWVPFTSLTEFKEKKIYPGKILQEITGRNEAENLEVASLVFNEY